jgi:hypothetical protein
MSDGPHRSLLMRKGWKKLAERGDGKLHTVEQIREAVPLALGDDWRAERCDDFMKQVRDVLVADQNTLFKPVKDDTIGALKKLPGSGYPLRRMLIDSLLQSVDDGHTGEEALVKGIADALAVRCSAGARHVEEHYLRASSERRATNVRSRIEEGASSADFNAIARQFCKLDKPATPEKYDGLDEGVSLR